MNRQNSPPSSQGTVESAYRAPESDVSRAPANDLLRAFVGKKNAQYYQQRFQRFESGGGAQTWHWPAFFFTSGWLLYRKMWWQAALYILGLPLLSVALTLLLAILLPLDVAELAINLGAVIFSMIFMPMYANRLYFDHANRKVASIAAAHGDPAIQQQVAARKGGTSWWGVLPIVVIVIGILAAIAFPAYLEYTARAQISQSYYLAAPAQTGVQDYVREHGTVPVDNEQAGLPPPSELGGEFVESVAIRDGEVLVSFGNASSSALTGVYLRLAPAVSGSRVTDWYCYRESIFDDESVGCGI